MLIIVDGVATYCSTHHRHMACRRFACPVCDYITTWFESVSVYNQPDGVVRTDPVYLKAGAEHTAFFDAHPHAARAQIYRDIVDPDSGRARTEEAA